MHFKNVEREITMTIPSSRPRQKLVFKPTVPESNPYHVATETLTVADKLKVLEALGHPELIEVFKDWQN